VGSQLVDAPPQRQIAIPPRQAAVIAGFAYLALNVVALVANFRVLGGLTVRGDAAATARAIADAELLFRGGIVAFIVVFVADVVVAWGLYVFLQPTSRELSLLAAWFRLLYVAIAATALLNLLTAVRLVSNTGYPASLSTNQRDAQVMASLDAYAYGWRIGMVFFGAHLLLLGCVMLRSDYTPRILAAMVALAGLAYMVGMLTSALLPNFEDYKKLVLLLIAIVAVPAEFGLAFWLVWRGGKDQPTVPVPAPSPSG
jgi:hypothetical protein